MEYITYEDKHGNDKKNVLNTSDVTKNLLKQRSLPKSL